MVEVAKETAKPDYLSLVNKGGSGFNVSELVDAIVGSEIEPKRNLQKTKQEKTENAISGIGFLKSQASTTQTSFTSLKSDTFFEISSSNTFGMVGLVLLLPCYLTLGPIGVFPSLVLVSIHLIALEGLD